MNSSFCNFIVLVLGFTNLFPLFSCLQFSISSLFSLFVSLISSNLSFFLKSKLFLLSLLLYFYSPLSFSLSSFLCFINCSFCNILGLLLLITDFIQILSSLDFNKFAFFFLFHSLSLCNSSFVF